MNSGIIKSLAVCAFGVIVTAGCASSPSSPSLASSSASQSAVRSGKITAVETVAVVDQSLVGTSSGNSAVVTTASSSGPTAVTVQFNDGSEGKYIIDRPTVAHTVGESVYVVTNGDRTGIMQR